MWSFTAETLQEKNHLEGELMVLDEEVAASSELLLHSDMTTDAFSLLEKICQKSMDAMALQIILGGAIEAILETCQEAQGFQPTDGIKRTH